jgi:predicted nucleic acid-binding protein
VYLIDTDVLSIASPVSPRSGANFDAWRDWLRRNADDVYLSSVTCMEISFGVAKSKRRQPGRKTVALELWLSDVLTLFDDRLCSITPDIACLAGEMLESAVASGFAPSSEDALIAATAKARGWTVLTRNAKDFAALGGQWRDPLEPRFLGLEK